MSILVATHDGLRTLGDDKTEFPGHTVDSLVLREGQLWAAVDGQRIEHRTDQGWAPVEKPSADGVITSFLPIDVGVLVAIAGAHLELFGERLDSFERAPTRDDWHTPWGGPADVRSMTEASDGTIYANVHVGGILRSGDRGGSWAPTIDLNDDVHQVRCPDPVRPDLIVAACAVGLAQSFDSGRTWTIRREGFRHAYSRAVAVAGDTVLVSTSNGPRGSEAAVYRSPLNDVDAPWEKCTDGLPEWFQGNIDTGHLAGTPDGQAALVTADGQLFESDDEGRTWRQRPERFSQPSWLIIT